MERLYLRGVAVGRADRAGVPCPAAFFEAGHALGRMQVANAMIEGEAIDGVPGIEALRYVPVSKRRRAPVRDNLL